jgi:hypothetical protein
MRRQTYITKLKDENNKTVNFERWSYKKISTIEKKLKRLYTEYYFLYKKDIKKAKYIVVYEASNNEKQIEVKRMLVSDFLNIE